MKTQLFFYVAVFCVLVSGPAQALIIEGQYHATITNVYDQSALDPGYSPYWNESILGQTLVANYWYDTSLAPAGTHYMPGIMTAYTSYGESSPNWLGMTTQINGQVFSTAAAFVAGTEITYRSNSISMYNYDNTDPTKADRFSMSDSITFVTPAGEEQGISFSLVISEAFYSLLESTELGQEFVWTGSGASTGFSSVGTNGVHNTQPYQWFAVLEPYYMTARVREASVPEPGSLALLLLGIVGVLLGRWNDIGRHVRASTRMHSRQDR